MLNTLHLSNVVFNKRIRLCAENLVAGQPCSPLVAMVITAALCTYITFIHVIHIILSAHELILLCFLIVSLVLNSTMQMIIKSHLNKITPLIASEIMNPKIV